MADEKFVSMLDLEKDTEELMGFNPEADANAMLPPVAAGPYTVIVRFAEDDPEKRWKIGIWGKGEVKTYYTNLSCTITGSTPELDGRVTRDMVSTFVGERSGTCSIQGVLQALGYQEQLRTVKSRSGLVALLNEALSAGDAVAETEWEWEATEPMTDEEREARKREGKKVWRLQGMARFEKDGDGNYVPSYNYQGVDCRAYNVIKRWVTKAQAQGSASAPAQTQTAPKPVTQTHAHQPKQATGPIASGAPRPVTQTAKQGPPIPAGAKR